MGVTIMKKVCRKLAKKYYTPLKKSKSKQSVCGADDR